MAAKFSWVDPTTWFPQTLKSAWIWLLSWKVLGFYPRPVLAFGYCHRPCLCICQCVCVCINHLLVRSITHQPFKLESPNLKHRCKTPWLRSLLFWGVIDLELQGQIQLESQILPHFELVRTITCHPFKLESPNLDKKCILVQLRCLLILGVINLQLHFQF